MVLSKSPENHKQIRGHYISVGVCAEFFSRYLSTYLSFLVCAHVNVAEKNKSVELQSM